MMMKLIPSLVVSTIIVLLAANVATGAEGDVCTIPAMCGDSEFCFKKLDETDGTVLKEGTCTVLSCDSLHAALKARNDNWGDLSCDIPYSGDQPGIMFSCGGVTTKTNPSKDPYTASFDLVEPAITKVWLRECTAMTDEEDEFICRDHGGANIDAANFDTFIQQGVDAELDKEQECSAAGKEPTYKYP